MRCKQHVYSPGGTFRGHCCMKNAVEDGYCRIHTPAYALERTAKRQAASEAREANSAYGQLKVARERIAELEAEILALTLTNKLLHGQIVSLTHRPDMQQFLGQESSDG